MPPFRRKHRVNSDVTEATYLSGDFGAQQLRGCVGKAPITSKNQANGIVRVMKKRGLPESLGAYKCKICRHWHVGKGQSRRRDAGE